MSRPLPPSLTLLTLLFVFLFNLPFSSSVHAQLFRPVPDSGRCSGFTEGQGLYIVGGHGTVGNFTTQTFMLDLSVSWNTSDPVFKKIQGGPMVTSQACTMTNNGEDLFVLSRGTGYVYNVKSDSWSVFQNNMFPDDTERYVGKTIATDPATGFVYVFDFAAEFSGEDVVLAVDLRTKTVNSIVRWDCVAPAYGGKKMVLVGKTMTTPEEGVIYILDVVKRTWKRAPATGLIGTGACAVSGDQFLVRMIKRRRSSSPLRRMCST
ncbi:MAG: hypothetical protein J3Q66DRAFT_370494 [Benniella sp.]|nr:MAG: hypothetical protein J3Q66DRAFT_370494 [Benniella sp.]